MNKQQIEDKLAKLKEDRTLVENIKNTTGSIRHQGILLQIDKKITYWEQKLEELS